MKKAKAIREVNAPPLSECKERANYSHSMAKTAYYSALMYARNAGEALIGAKAHMRTEAKCRWTKWLKENFEGSLESARGYMRIARHWEDAAVVAARESSDIPQTINGVLKVIRTDRKSKPVFPKMYETPDEGEAKVFRKVIWDSLRDRLKALSQSDVKALMDCGVEPCWGKFCEELQRLSKLHRDGEWPPEIEGPSEEKREEIQRARLAKRRKGWRKSMRRRQYSHP